MQSFFFFPPPFLCEAQPWRKKWCNKKNVRQIFHAYFKQEETSKSESFDQLIYEIEALFFTYEALKKICTRTSAWSSTGHRNVWWRLCSLQRCLSYFKFSSLNQFGIVLSLWLFRSWNTARMRACDIPKYCKTDSREVEMLKWSNQWSASMMRVRKGDRKRKMKEWVYTHADDQVLKVNHL